MATKKLKRTRKRKKTKTKSVRVPNPFIFKAPVLPYTTGVLGDDEFIGAGDMSQDFEATETRVVSLGYKAILSARETARKKAREEHNKWLRDHGL